MNKPLVQNDIMKSSEYHQFYLGVLLQNDSYINEVYNKQIGLMYDTYTKKLSPPFEEEYNSFNDTGLEIEGFIVGKTYNILGIDMPSNIVSLFKTKLKNNYYIKYTGDSYYIKSKNSDVHCWSDIFLIEYKNPFFIGVGVTNNGMFQEYEISEKEIIDTITKRVNVDIYSQYTYYLEVDFYKCKMESKYGINPDVICSRLVDYLTPQTRDRYILGINVIQALLLEWEAHGVNQSQIKYLLDRMRLMVDRLSMLDSLGYINKECVDEYQAIFNDFNNILCNTSFNQHFYVMVSKLFMKEIEILKNVLSSLSSISIANV